MTNPDPVQQFERNFSSYVGTRHAVAVSSGTTGLIAVMMALQMNPGDNVVTTPLTFIATANSVLSAGGVPVFADIDRETLCVNPEGAKKNIDSKTKGVIGVHLYGLPFDVEAFDEARQNGIKVVEDAAQALGASNHGKKVGSLGDAAVFSFYETKHIGLGEGGMIATNDGELAELCRMIRSHGQSRKYYHIMLGYNFRLPASIASAGLKQLSGIEREVRRRRRIAKVYAEELGTLRGVSLQRVDGDVTHSYYMFPLLVEGVPLRKLDGLAHRVSLLTSCEVRRGYGLLAYQQPFYRNLNGLYWGAKLMRFPDYSTYHLPSAEYAVKRIIELPTDDTVDEGKAGMIAESLVKEVRRLGTK